ncbi:hypothetical protein DSECCO2_491640 [anaerobic digester metagenome]
MATAVEPRPAITSGTFSLIGFLERVATAVVMSTFSKKALSGVGSMPCAPISSAMIWKWDQSRWNSLLEAAVLLPKYSGRGYSTSRPRKADLPTSQRTLQSSTHMGHIPFTGLISGTRVLVPVVDLLFSMVFKVISLPLLTLDTMAYDVRI